MPTLPEARHDEMDRPGASGRDSCDRFVPCGGARLEPSRAWLYQIELRVPVSHEEQSISENRATANERRLLICLPLDLAVHAHRDEPVTSLINCVLGIEEPIVQNRRLGVGAEIRILEQLGHTIGAVVLFLHLDHCGAGPIGSRNE